VRRLFVPDLVRPIVLSSPFYGVTPSLDGRAPVLFAIAGDRDPPNADRPALRTPVIPRRGFFF